MVEENVGHWADCAVYNAPAFQAGECTCGGRKLLRYGIEISSWVGTSAGAVHYYGKAWRYDDSQIVKHEIERELTEPQAKALNRLDNESSIFMPGMFRWRTGMMTGRYDTREQVIADGIRLLREEYGEEVQVVEVGSAYEIESEELTVADWQGPEPTERTGVDPYKDEVPEGIVLTPPGMGDSAV